MVSGILVRFVLGVSLAIAAFAQEEKSPFRQDTSIEIITLKTLSPENAVVMLEEVLPGPTRFATDASTNSIILSASEQTIQKAKQIIAELESLQRERGVKSPLPNPRGAAPKRIEYKLVPFHLDDSFLSFASSTISRHSRVYAATERLLLIHGTDEDIKKVAALVDAASASRGSRGGLERDLVVSFFFLAAQTSGSRPAGGSEKNLPQALQEALQPAAAALARNGFLRPTLLAPLIVSVNRAERKFHLYGSSPKLDRIQVEGEATAGPDDKSVELTVSIELVARKQVGDNVVSQTVFELQTTLTARLGEYIILAAAPAAAQPDIEAIALVVRVSAAE